MFDFIRKPSKIVWFCLTSLILQTSACGFHNMKVLHPDDLLFQGDSSSAAELTCFMWITGAAESSLVTNVGSRYTLACLAFRMLRQQDWKSEASQGYTVTPCPQNNKSRFQFWKARVWPRNPKPQDNTSVIGAQLNIVFLTILRYFFE